jgi:uroporphyrinogen-III synthase
MRLLVTRPEPEAEETAARLRAMGYDVTVQPMLRVVFSPPPEDLPEPAALIATSRNGVRALAAWPVAAGWRRAPLFVTSEGTAATAAAAGFTDVRSGGADSAALAGRIVRDLDRTAGAVVYAAARDRAGALAGGLTAAGYDLRVVEAYRAEPVAALDPAVAAALREGQIDGVLFFSRRTAEAFVAAVSAAGLADLLGGIVLYALSDRVAQPLRALSSAIFVAPHPDWDGIAVMISAASASQLA